MDATRLRGNDDAPAHRLGHVITQGLGDRIERQRPVDQPLDKFQPTHLVLPFGTDGPIGLAGDIHDGSIGHCSWPVSRFSDIIILPETAAPTIAPRERSLLA